jgi:hypothetical protein
VIDYDWESEILRGRETFTLWQEEQKEKGQTKLAQPSLIRVKFNLLELLPAIGSESKQTNPQ